MRHANRVLAALLSLALIAAGVLLIIEVIAGRVSHRPAVVDSHPADAWANSTTWNAGSVRVACAVLMLLGLALLIAELKPARVSRLAADPAQAGAAGIDTAYTRRGLAAAIRSAVTGVDGVRGRLGEGQTPQNHSHGHHRSPGQSRRPQPARPDPGRRPPAPDRIEAPPVGPRWRCESPPGAADARRPHQPHPAAPAGIAADRRRRRGRRCVHRGVRDHHPAQPPDRQPGRALHRHPRRLALASRRLTALILALLALRWLLALLFSTDRAGDLPITPGGSAGRTTLAARALTEAVAEETESYLGVNFARARLVGDPAGPKLVVHRRPGGNR